LERRALLGCLAVSVAAPRLSSARAFPSKPIRIVHGYSAASNLDTIARLISPSLIETLGQSVIVEPKPGAGERIAAQYLISQPADGYTLYLMTGGANVISATDRQPPFNTLRDFSYISTITLFPFALFVGARSPLNTFQDLRTAAAANLGRLNYGHSGVGNTLHLAVEYLKGLSGMKMEPIAYMDTGQQIADLESGRLDVVISTFTAYHGAVANQQVRAIGVTSKERWPLNPDVSPIAADVPGYEVVSWPGLAAPAGLPAEVAERLSSDVKVAVARPEAQERLKGMGNDARAGPPAEFRARIEADHAKWTPLPRFVNP
jgi:tripartite-type tricarboxylate transporter receptor subunit TctC